MKKRNCPLPSKFPPLLAPAFAAAFFFTACARQTDDDKKPRRGDKGTTPAPRTADASDPDMDDLSDLPDKPTTWKHGPHWVQDEKLRQVMKEIARYVLAPEEDAGPTDAGLKQPPEKFFTDASALANGLAFTASRIPDAVADRAMSDEDRKGFTAEAKRLRQQAATLRGAAQARDTKRMQSELKEIHATCVACHSRYRDFAGELNNFRAEASSLRLLETSVRLRPIHAAGVVDIGIGTTR